MQNYQTNITQHDGQQWCTCKLYLWNTEVSKSRRCLSVGIGLMHRIHNRLLPSIYSSLFQRSLEVYHYYPRYRLVAIKISSLLNQQLFHHWSSSFNSLLGHIRSRSRCWTAISLSCHPFKTVRPCTSWGGWWIGQWRTTDSMVSSSVPHSQAAKGAILHLCKHEQKHLTPVQKRLSCSHALLDKAIPRGWVLMSGMKAQSLIVFSNHSAFHRCYIQTTALFLFSSDKLMLLCLYPQLLCSGYKWVSRFDM